MKALMRGFRGVGVGVLTVGVAVGVLAVRAGRGQEKAEKAAQAKEEIQWTTYEDTVEHAFRLEVPQGWTVKGGLFRFGFSDERPMVDITSSDGRINLRVGDVSIPSYTVPSQNHMREGEVYDLGAQAQLIVARYRTGPEFAILYSHVRFYGTCKNPTADSTDVGGEMPDYIHGASSENKSSKGQIAYRCETKQGPMVAFAAVKTSLAQGIWQAPTMLSFIAPASDVQLAKKTLEHCAQTFQLKPEWLDYQKRMDAQGLQYQRMRQQQRMQQLAQQVQQFEQQMHAMQNQVNAFERHQQAQSAQVESFTQALRGVTPTIDPMTGEAKEVWTEPNSNYWTNGVGDVVNSVNGPPGWHQLQTPNQ